MTVVNHILVIGVVIFGTVACSEQPPVAEAPPPAELTREAIGQFCGMIVADHEGPKGQVFIAGRDQPLWFPSVRDTLVYLMLPEETGAVRAVYVSDMARASSWEHPGEGAWMRAEQAWFVVGSTRIGSMGVSEVVPFSSREAAEEFAAQFGGRLERMDGIQDDVLMGRLHEPVVAFEGPAGEIFDDRKDGVN